MKQFEYLRELKENLESHMTPDEINDILSDYESFFISGKEEGKTEDEISGELGSPAFLAKTLIEEQRRLSVKGKHWSKEAAEPGETIKETGSPGTTGNKALHTRKRTADPGRRMCAFLIDALIAIIPVSIASFMAGAMLIPYLLFVSYPAPVVGTLISMSFQAYSSYSEYSTHTYEVTDPSKSFDDGTGTPDAIGPVISSYAYRIGLNGRRNYITPVKARIISIMAIIGIVFYLFYSFTCTLLFKGQTIGKKIMGIRVVSSNAQSITATAAFCREFLGKTLINSIPLVAFISFLTILITPEHKALHDMLTGTVVADVKR